jgi:rhomboid protease GluP
VNASLESGERFPIRFSEQRALAAANNSWHLFGPGELQVLGDELAIRGRTGGFLGLGRKYRELHLPLAQVLNVVGRDAELRLEFHAPGQKPRHLLFWAADAATAERIRAALPQRMTEQFRTQLAETRDFVKRLDAVGGTARVTRVLVVANVIVFAAMTLAGAGLLIPNPEVHIRWGSNVGPLTAGGQWWRLFTSMFLHFGAVHLLLNMWALQVCGTLTERFYGSGRYLLLYLCSGVAGSVASLLWNPVVNSAGASGAIFGVLGALLAFVLNKRNGIPPSIVLAQRRSLGAFLAYNLIFGIVNPVIDNAAHLGGLVSGFLLGKLLARPLDPAARAQGGKGRALLRRVREMLRSSKDAGDR